MISLCKKATTEPKFIGTYRGFDMDLSFNTLAKEHIIELKKHGYYIVSLGSDIYGNITRIDNAIDNIPKKLESSKQLLDDTFHQKNNTEIEIRKPFIKEDELNNCIQRLSEVNKLLNFDNKDIVEFEDESIDKPIQIKNYMR